MSDDKKLRRLEAEGKLANERLESARVTLVESRDNFDLQQQEVGRARADWSRAIHDHKKSKRYHQWLRRENSRLIGLLKSRSKRGRSEVSRLRKDIASARLVSDELLVASKEAFRRLRAAELVLEHKRSDCIVAEMDYEDAWSRLCKIEEAKTLRQNLIIAKKAGVPEQYLNDLKVVTKSNGTTHIYFGGIDSPDGEGHAHYVVNSEGFATYRRDPFAPRGWHNYIQVGNTMLSPEVNC